METLIQPYRDSDNSSPPKIKFSEGGDDDEYVVIEFESPYRRISIEKRYLKKLLHNLLNE